MKKTIILVVILVVALVGYFMFFRKSASAKADAIPAANSDDEMTFKAMVSAITENVGSGTMSAALDEVKNIVQTAGSYRDGRIIDPSYLVAGRVTKTGALMSVYVSSIQSYSGGNDTEDTALTQSLYKQFYDFRLRNTIV